MSHWSRRPLWPAASQRCLWNWNCSMCETKYRMYGTEAGTCGVKENIFWMNFEWSLKLQRLTLWEYCCGYLLWISSSLSCESNDWIPIPLTLSRGYHWVNNSSASQSQHTHMVFSARVEVILSTQHRRTDALVLQSHFPPGVVHLLGFDLSTEHIPTPLVNQVAERQERELLQCHAHQVV